MNKLLACLITMLGLGSACGQQKYENIEANAFATLIKDSDVSLVDVRTAEEYAEGHISGAINIDFRKNDFMEKAKSQLDKSKKIAVYCRSGRRSASAATMLASEGYKVVNMLGGIVSWKDNKLPTVTSAYELDTFTTPAGKPLQIYALVHASIRISYDGMEIEIDPVSKLGNRTIDYSSMPRATHIFVTHEHGDHFDKGAIAQCTGDNTLLVTNSRCAEMLGHGDVMANGDKKTLAEGRIEVEAVPAYNTTPGREKFHPKGRDNGYILTIDGLRIYIAGDTEDIPEMAGIKDIDIAFLPCNQPYTMTTDQLEKAARMVKPKVLFPYHYGNTDVSHLPEALKNDGIDVRIRHYE